MADDPLGNAPRRPLIHHLCPRGRGIHVTVAAGLVALAANVNLKRLQRRTTQAELMAGELLLKPVHTR